MSETIEITDVADLPQVSEAWDRLRQQQRMFCPDARDLIEHPSVQAGRFVVLGTTSGDSITSLCCFVSETSSRRYAIGERHLFSLPVRQAVLFGAAVLGGVDASVLRHFVDRVRQVLGLDLLAFGETVIGSPLYAAVQGLGSRYLVYTPSRRDSVRWLIEMPDDFEEYLASLGSKTRQMVRQSMRKFAGSFRCEFKVITEPDQVAAFLRDGEAISRLTYQWNVGQRLCNDEATLRLYRAQAERGRLRCHLLYADDVPCSFSRGEIIGGVYNYHTPGFDPKFSKTSPGIVTLMLTIKDLIENTRCRTFDFGEGGDDTGYKSKFGNVSQSARYLYVSGRRRPYSIALFLLQLSLNGLKNAASAVAGHGVFRQRLKRAVRRYGAPRG